MPKPPLFCIHALEPRRNTVNSHACGRRVKAGAWSAADVKLHCTQGVRNPPRLDTAPDESSLSGQPMGALATRYSLSAAMVAVGLLYAPTLALYGRALGQDE